MERQESLHIYAQPGVLSSLAQWVEDFGRQYQIPEPFTGHLNLILEELFTNIVNHGAAEGESPVPVSLTLTMKGDSVELKIADAGAPFDPRELETPNFSDSLEERAIGGLGVYFVKELADTLDYEYRDGWNITRIEKRVFQESKHDC